jgi:hypothetical protein
MTKYLKAIPVLIAVICSSLTEEAYSAEAIQLEKPSLPLIKPAVTTATGLLLQPDLDLSGFSAEEFNTLSSSIGLDRIHKKWTVPVVTLPSISHSNLHGLSHQEVKDYMFQVRDLFNAGNANPVSDVGLISTQEDVIRRPMLNHIAAFSNATVRAFLLVQKTSTDKGWGYFSIVQDLTIDPPLDYFAEIRDKEIKFEGANCYKCHSSGPLAIHPARADLVYDAPLAAAISRHIAKQPISQFYFPPNEKKLDYGKPLALEFCTKCHDTDGTRLPLFKVHAHPIRILVDYGYMPPKHPLTTNEVAELKAWLESKP